MLPYFYETKIVENSKIVLKDLPLINGDKVDIILLKHSPKMEYSLRGTHFKYINPTEPIAEYDWNR